MLIKRRLASWHRGDPPSNEWFPSPVQVKAFSKSIIAPSSISNLQTQRRIKHPNWFSDEHTIRAP